jgi:hypothetical protein
MENEVDLDYNIGHKVPTMRESGDTIRDMAMED